MNYTGAFYKTTMNLIIGSYLLESETFQYFIKAIQQIKDYSVIPVFDYEIEEFI